MAILSGVIFIICHRKRAETENLNEITTWNAIIKVHDKCNELLKALKLYQGMKTSTELDEVKGDPFTFCMFRMNVLNAAMQRMHSTFGGL